MSVLLNPYISFRDDARQAMEFYRSVFGGDLTMSTFGESGMAQDPSSQDGIMHAQLTTPDGFTLMASDTPGGMEFQEGSRVTISLSGDDDSTLRGYWDALSDGGTVAMPLEKAPWGDSFGMCVDRFGVSWFVNIAGGGGAR